MTEWFDSTNDTNAVVIYINNHMKLNDLFENTKWYVQLDVVDWNAGSPQSGMPKSFANKEQALQHIIDIMVDHFNPEHDDHPDNEQHFAFWNKLTPEDLIHSKDMGADQVIDGIFHYALGTDGDITLKSGAPANMPKTTNNTLH